MDYLDRWLERQNHYLPLPLPSPSPTSTKRKRSTSLSSYPREKVLIVESGRSERGRSERCVAVKLRRPEDGDVQGVVPKLAEEEGSGVRPVTTGGWFG